ncbi:hypothetical protein D3C87_2206720 [compost metagenome]
MGWRGFSKVKVAGKRAELPGSGTFSWPNRYRSTSGNRPPETASTRTGRLFQTPMRSRWISL